MSRHRNHIGTLSTMFFKGYKLLFVEYSGGRKLMVTESGCGYKFLISKDPELTAMTPFEKDWNDGTGIHHVPTFYFKRDGGEDFFKFTSWKNLEWFCWEVKNKGIAYAEKMYRFTLPHHSPLKY